MIPVEDENTHKMIERHASSSKEDPITADVLMNEFKDFDKDKDHSIKQTDSKPTSKMIYEQTNQNSESKRNINILSNVEVIRSHTEDKQSLETEKEAQKI